MDERRQPSYTPPLRFTLHDRAFPHSIMDGVWMWSVDADETETVSGTWENCLNGYLLQTGDQESVLVDPPCGGPEVLDAFNPLPRPQAIILTSNTHERASDEFRQAFRIPVLVPETDATGLSVAADRIYRDGDVLFGGWQAMNLKHQTTPGESALYHAERQVLVLGNALAGRPMQFLSMLPDSFYKDKLDAVQGLLPLTRLAVKAVLVGHGDPVLRDAQSVLADALVARPVP